MRLLLWLPLIVCTLSVAGEEDLEQFYQRNEIPPTALKGNLHVLKNGKNGIDYVEQGTGKTIVKEEYYKNGQLRSRLLFKDGKKHGIQRAWFENGHMESEESYALGIMNGLFRCWNENGKLAGQYKMIKGTGIRKVFYASGGLQEEEPYLDNELHGIRREYFESGQIRVFGEWKNGVSLSPGMVWLDTGEVVMFWRGDPNGKRRGIHLDLRASNPETGKRIIKASYVIDGEIVTGEEYQKQATTDPSLPRYEANPENYNALIEGTIKAYTIEIGDNPRKEQGPNVDDKKP